MQPNPKETFRIANCRIESVSNESQVQLCPQTLTDINEDTLKSLQNTLDMDISDLTVPTESVIYGPSGTSRLRRRPAQGTLDDSLNFDFESLGLDLKSTKKANQTTGKRQIPLEKIIHASWEKQQRLKADEGKYQIIVNNAPVFYKIRFLKGCTSVLKQIGLFEGKTQNNQSFSGGVGAENSDFVFQDVQVLRRYSDFRLLFSRLRKVSELIEVPSICNKTSLRDLFSRNWEEFYSRRKIHLQIFLTQLLPLQSFFSQMSVFADFFDPVRFFEY